MLKYIFIDFLLLLLIISLILSFSCFIKKIIYTDERYLGKISLTSRPLYYEYLSLIHEGDEVFDCITKRKIGVILSLSSEVTEGGVKLYLIIDAERKIKAGADAVRTKELFVELMGAPVYG